VKFNSFFFFEKKKLKKNKIFGDDIFLKWADIDLGGRSLFDK